MAVRLNIRRSTIFYLLICLLVSYLTGQPLKLTHKKDCLNLETLVVARNASYVRIESNCPRVKKATKQTGMAKTLSTKLHTATRLLTFTLAANLVLLSNDVSLNPGPVGFAACYSPLSSIDTSFSSQDSELHGSFGSQNGDSFTSNSELECELYPYFNLGLDEKGLRIGHWNINHITSTKFDQIKLFLTGKFGKPQVDVLFLNETFLKNDIPDSLYAVPGFTIYRRDRLSKCGGGVLAFVNEELSVKRRTDLENCDLEIIWLEVFPFKSNRSLLMAGIYRPPSYSKADDIALETNIERVYLLNQETILLGDFNIDFNNTQSYSKHRLCKGLKNMNFKQLVNETTRPISGTCLDHILSNHPQRIQNIGCHNIGLSDHLPLFAVRKYCRSREQSGLHKGNTFIRYRDMKKFDEKKFKSTLRQAPWDTIFVFDDIDDMLDSWESLFNDALDTHCPWRNKRVARVNQVPWMTNSIIVQLRTRDTLLKIFKRSRNADDWAKYTVARNRAVTLIRSAKTKFYSTTFERDKNNPRGMWKTIKSLMGSSKQKHNVKCLNVDECVLEDNEQKAEAFNKHFSTVADRLRSILPQMKFDLSRLLNFVKSKKDESILFSIPPISNKKIISSLMKMGSNKATGIDKISVKMLKIAAPIVAPSIARLINYSITSEVFPQRWKIAKVTPLFKSGDSSNVTNYRPISVLPILSKLIERHVHDALYSYLSDNNLLYTRQSGFRKIHSTETALIKIVDDLLFSLDKNRVSGMILIDYCKAFDMIDHSILLEKLQAYGMVNSSVNWFQSYLNDRRQLVSLGGKQSSMTFVHHGVPQGSILGPLLFIAFINDLPLHVGSSMIDLYADDTTLTSSSNYDSINLLQESLNNSITEVVDWATANKLPINESKTKALLVTGKRLLSKIEVNPTIMVNKTEIELVSSVKLLGLEIDSELSFHPHVDKLCKKLSQRIAILKKIRSCLPLKQRLLYYNAMIRPIMDYVNVIWTSCDNESLGRILKLQKRAARVILNTDYKTPSVQLFNKLKWLPFYEEAKLAKCCLAYKRINNQVPIYIKDMLMLNSERHTRNTRYGNINLVSPKFIRKTEGGRTFTVTTCQAWNALSLDCRKVSSYSIFRSHYWNILFKEQQFLNHFIV